MFQQKTSISGHYFEDVPLSRILTIENKVKQIPPRPDNTRAGTK